MFLTTGVLPAHALLLRDFAYTIGVAAGTDELTGPAELRAWLRDHALVADGAVGADVRTAVALRESLRGAMRSHHHQPGEAVGGDAHEKATGPAAAESAAAAAALAAAAAGLTLRITELAGSPALGPAEPGVRGGLARIAAAIVASTADRSWERLKVCADDSCQSAFFGSSKNRSRHWCSMRECGNRSKTRAYRARRARGARWR